MTHARAPGLALVAVLVACGPSSGEPAPLPPATPVAPPPAAPTLATMAAPASGHATLALPARVNGLGRGGYDATLRTWTAHFGKGSEAAQIQLGDRDGMEHATIAFYGHDLAVGHYEIGPATDETVAAHAGRDDSIFTVELRLPGHDLRSVSGSVDITAIDDQHVVGTVDVVVKEIDGLAPFAPSALVRFDASYDRYIEGWIQSEAEVRAQLRARSPHH